MSGVPEAIEPEIVFAEPWQAQAFAITVSMPRAIAASNSSFLPGGMRMSAISRIMMVDRGWRVVLSF